MVEFSALKFILVEFLALKIFFRTFWDLEFFSVGFPQIFWDIWVSRIYFGRIFASGIFLREILGTGNLPREIIPGIYGIFDLKDFFLVEFSALKCFWVDFGILISRFFFGRSSALEYQAVWITFSDLQLPICCLGIGIATAKISLIIIYDCECWIIVNGKCWSTFHNQIDTSKKFFLRNRAVILA